MGFSASVLQRALSYSPPSSLFCLSGLCVFSSLSPVILAVGFLCSSVLLHSARHLSLLSCWKTCCHSHWSWDFLFLLSFLCPTRSRGALLDTLVHHLWSVCISVSVTVAVVGVKFQLNPIFLVLFLFYFPFSVVSYQFVVFIAFLLISCFRLSCPLSLPCFLPFFVLLIIIWG